MEIYRARYETVAKGEHAVVNEEYLDEIRLLNILVANIITTAQRQPPELKELVNVAIEAFKLFGRFEPIARLYVASMIDLLTAMAKLARNQTVEDYWECLTDLNLLPYQVGLRTSVPELIAGKQRILTRARTHPHDSLSYVVAALI